MHVARTCLFGCNMGVDIQRLVALSKGDTWYTWVWTSCRQFKCSKDHSNFTTLLSMVKVGAVLLHFSSAQLFHTQQFEHTSCCPFEMLPFWKGFKPVCVCTLSRLGCLGSNWCPVLAPGVLQSSLPILLRGIASSSGCTATAPTPLGIKTIDVFRPGSYSRFGASLPSLACLWLDS